MSTVRLKRLIADHDQLQEYVRSHPRLKLLQCDGEPPERYHLEYRINSLRSSGGELTQVKNHTVEIVLPRNYPRTPPLCRMLTPVFHPNIAPHAICVGDHWSAGEPLQSIVTRIGELLAYQSYNVKSPLNGEAARWVAENQEKLPLDPVSLLPEERTPTAVPAESEPKPSAAHAPVESRKASEPPRTREPSVQRPPEPETTACQVACPSCEKRFTVEREWLGRRAKCPSCANRFELSPVEGA